TVAVNSAMRARLASTSVLLASWARVMCIRPSSPVLPCAGEQGRTPVGTHPGTDLQGCGRDALLAAVGLHGARWSAVHPLRPARDGRRTARQTGVGPGRRRGPRAAGRRRDRDGDRADVVATTGAHARGCGRLRTLGR